MKRLLTLLCAVAMAAVSSGVSAGPPSVSLTYPAPNSVIDLAATGLIRLQVSVSDPDDSIVDVTYFVCIVDCSRSPASPAGVSTVAPYDFSWRPAFVLATGELAAYTVWAEARNASGQSAVSNIVPFLVDQPPLPTGMLVAPTPSLRHEFVLPAAPTFYVQATPAPSTAIARVDFLDDGEIIGTLAASNAVPSGYAFTWRGPTVGEHRVSARVTDSDGNSAASAPVSIYIGDPDEPARVALTSPRTGQIYTSADAVPLAATASSSQGSIERIEFRVGETVIASARSAPYTATWGGPPPGNLAIAAVAFDDLGVASISPPAYVQVLDAPRRPAVVLTAPTPGGTFPGGAPLNIVADALSPDGTISRVEFYAGAALLGSAASAPYAMSWSNPQIGTQSLTAKAYDARNAATVSAPVAVTVTSSLVPMVSLTAPPGGATFNAPAAIAISAEASESNGTIAKVDFYANGSAIGSKSAAPYSITWSNVAAGGYTLYAKAIDGTGATATSASVPVTVYPPSPAITLAGPSGANAFASGESIVLIAQATAPGSTISKIVFDSDGMPIGTIVASSGASSGTFSLNWTAGTAGTHALSAKVVAASGATATSNAIAVTVANLAVALLEPATGQAFQSSTPIPLAASPSITGAAIARVEFYADGALVAASSAPPYSAAWSGAGIGSHSVTAKVLDTTGLAASSSAATVAVISSATIQVDGGVDGASVGDDYVSISGRIQAPLNSAITIDGRAAVLDLNGSFFIDGLRLQSGANAIPLTLNAQGLAPVVKTINVTSSGAAPFEVSLDKQEGLAPLTTGLSITNRGKVAFNRITVDITDDGVADFVITALPSGGTTQQITYGAPGLYTIRVAVYDTNDNRIYTTTRRVRAIDPSEIGYKVASVYTSLVDSLAANNVSGALTAFVDGAQARYASVFADLGAALPTIAIQLGRLSNISLNEDIAELTVARPVGSDTQLFMIYLLRGNDGLWRIETI